MLRDENATLQAQISKLKDEVKQLELKQSHHESVKAELEYNLRAAEYNVEILKNQVENMNSEVALMRKQNEKQKRNLEMMRSSNERMQIDCDFYKK